jgi:hypothetical protein
VEQPGDDAGRVEDIRVTHEESNHILDRKPEGLASIEWRFDGPDQRDRPGRTVKSVRPFFIRFREPVEARTKWV